MSESYLSELERIDKFYEAEEKRLEDRESLSILGLELAVQRMNFDSRTAKKQKEKVDDLITAMRFQTRYKKKVAKKEALVKELLKEKEKNNAVYGISILALEEEIERRVRKRKLYNDSSRYSEYLDRMVKKICSNPLTAALEFIDEYMNTAFDLENLYTEKQKEIEKAGSKVYSVKKAKEEPDYESETYTSRTSTAADYDYEEVRKEPPRVTKESIQKEIDDELAKGNEYLDDSLLIKIVDFYSKTDNLIYFGEFYEKNSISNIYKFYVLSNTANTLSRPIDRYEKMMDMGLLAIDIIFKDLMNGKLYQKTNMAKFMDQFDQHGTLERYEKAREQYIKLYRGLNSREKKRVDDYANGFEGYRKTFGIHDISGDNLATSEQIKKVVNARIRERYLEDNIIDRYYKVDGYFNPDFHVNFNYSLKYMSVEGIVGLFFELKNRKRESFGYYEHEEPYEKEIGAVQRLFADAIRRRIGDNDKNFDIEEEREKEEYLKEQEKDLVGICKDYLHEEPLFPLTYIKVTDVKDGYGKQRVESGVAVQEAKRRYFGLSKLQQVVAILDFRKLKSLAKKKSLTDEEIAQVGRMFRS